ncbi:helix-turn-helix transcriptional regulator [Actinoplanes sp. OR16]|uniref:LuxR C-terminal-related transcriptional regulator n=1 Tax=Actinoplanes sp. OR16 TaxID=946334 RepID=UPI000F6F4B19|nr:LuxR C-terminal-related transcriptional regulator [Actinoplanes sp. OR16]BBH69503.1 helix-turn-helix transcriptional regulator [Actinoplanes sp. OR16]
MDGSLRQNDRALLARAAGNLARVPGIPLIFGGVGTTDVPVTVSIGGRTSALTSLVIRPERGLGGKALVEKRLLALPRYDSAPGITHDYDEPVLSEGIVGLAVVPLMSGSHVRGLLYAGTRDGEALTPEIVSALAAEGQAASLAISVRDFSERLRAIAGRTSDAATRQELLELVEQPRPAVADPLTPRQREVIELAGIGLRNAEIGARLGLSEQTVKTYMRALMVRLGARSRSEAVHRYRSSRG